MGTRERRQRDFDDRERLFLHAARDLIREEGLLNVQMSRIADRCEYAVGTLYQHFRSKEDLLLALTQESALQHVDLFQRVTKWKASTRERMFGIGVADMIFVRRNPEHFRVAQYALCEAVWNAASEDRRQSLLATHELIGGAVDAVVNEALARGDLEPAGFDAEQVGRGCWALTYGTHQLVHAKGVVRDVSIDASYRLMCRHLQSLLNGYGWKPLADTSDDRALDDLIKRVRREVFDDLCTDEK